MRIMMALLGAFVLAGAPRLEPKLKMDEIGDRVPVYFEPNLGQMDPQVRFLARGANYQAWITARELVLGFNGKAGAERDLVRIRFGAQAPRSAAGMERLGSYSNYYLGNDRSRWRTHVPHYGRARLEEVYPGVDIVFYGKGREIEYDFEVKAGADPDSILLDIESGQMPRMSRNGEVLVPTRFGVLRQHAPAVFQGKQRLEARSELVGRSLRFAVEGHNPSLPLTIDPVLGYATLLGGSSDDGAVGIGLDFPGNIYIAGNTQSSSFPTTPGAYDTSLGGSSDMFIAKFNSTATSLLYSTYLGGTGFLDQATGLAVDMFGNATISGATNSFDFPTTGNFGPGGFSDAVAARFGPTGTLVYSVKLGGAGSDFAFGVAMDTFGNSYLTGEAAGAGFFPPVGFPVTPGAYDTNVFFPGMRPFVARLNSSGGLSYATYLGPSGRGYGIGVDSAGNAYVAGATSSGSPFVTTPGAYDTTPNGDEDVFVAKLNPFGNMLVYGTLIGGPGSDVALALAVDGGGNAYVTGRTFGPGYPLTPGAFDTTYNPANHTCFVTKLNSSGSALSYSTLLSGSSYEACDGIAVDGTGNAHVTGTTNSFDFPGGAIGGTFAFNGNVIVSKLNPTGTTANSGFFGGASGSSDNGTAIALDFSGNAYIAGATNHASFPTTAGTYDTSFNGINDAFVARFSFPAITDSTPPVITANVAPPANGAGWHKLPANVTWTVVDNESPITSQTACGPTLVSADTAGLALTCTATSAGGTASESVTVRLDQVLPSINASQAPPANGAGWNNSNVTVTFNCSDGLSGVTSCTPPVQVTAEGITPVSGAATDVAGNSAGASQTVKLDKTPPGISASLIPPDGLNGWYINPVVITWTCTDALSGVVTGSIVHALAGDGANQSATATCFDVAGNSNGHTQTGIHIDRTSPVLHLPADITVPATSPLGAVVTYTVGVTDNLDPAPTYVCDFGSGSQFPIGVRVVTCTGSDRAGNATSPRTFTVTVVGALGQTDALIQILTSFNIGNKANGMFAKLNNIRSMVQSGNTNPACNVLGALINEFQAKSGKDLTVPQANQLISLALQIKATLGC